MQNALFEQIGDVDDSNFLISHYFVPELLEICILGLHSNIDEGKTIPYRVNFEKILFEVQNRDFLDFLYTRKWL